MKVGAEFEAAFCHIDSSETFDSSVSKNISSVTSGWFRLFIAKKKWNDPNT